jgi:GMP synthase-like glutamine amidotransferase
MNKPVVLLIQFRSTPRTDQFEYDSIARALGSEVEVRRVSGLQSDLLPLVKRSNGVVIGGSGDFDFDGARANDDPIRIATHRILEQLKPSLHYLRTVDKPTFGICFGHQLLGAFHGVPVFHDRLQHKQRTHGLVLRDEGSDYEVTSGIPIHFLAHYGHKDVLGHVPSGAVLLADGGISCQVSALAYSPAIVSTQFHPELTLDDLVLRANHIPQYLPDDTTVDTQFTDAPHASKWLSNFSNLVQRQVLRQSTAMTIAA